MNALPALLGLWCALLAPQEESPLGDKKVNIKTAWYLKGPSRLSEVAGKAGDGDEVTVLAIEGRYAKVTVKKTGETLYIDKTALIAPTKWQRSAGDEKEGNTMAAQGLEGQKGLNPETEKEWKSQGGPAREKAYADLDRVMALPDYRSDRQKLEDRLKEFRRSGKLGEFSPVK
ncbi:MAG TPA: hypothetical protein VEN81_12485 [Planctomycetota bacterium]|nr:hypothetical protein [Planctomycetota bacterium]